METITKSMLQGMCNRINKVMGMPETPWTGPDENGKYHANIGNYHLSGAYGGWCVERMETDGGGVSQAIFSGHRPKREAFELMRAYLNGIEEKS